MRTDRYPPFDEVRALVHEAQRARTREIRRVLGRVMKIMLDSLKRPFAPKRVAIPE